MVLIPSVAFVGSYSPAMVLLYPVILGGNYSPALVLISLVAFGGSYSLAMVVQNPSLLLVMPGSSSAKNSDLR